MIKKRHLVKAQKFVQQICKQSISAIKKQIIWLLRTLFQTRKRRNSVNAGFVLPTVAMVALVVVLLTTAILFRSFERSKNASNVRVNEAVLNATAPAIDRAKSKLNKLLTDSRLPRATPTDTALESAFNSYINEYTLGDETQLKLISGTDNLFSAWRYPVDTDNNGLFDSYTLYGIYFKNPPVSNGAYTRARNSLEARTPPMTGGGAGDACKDTNGTSATLVGSSGWFKIGSKLKKAFFVYTANVPITDSGTLPTGYERYKGNKGFSAIEYQQERVQLPLVNNAVVYEDDLELTPGGNFKLNGRIITNSNFLTGAKNLTDKAVTLYQISSKDSCFYEADNAKIIIGGNLGAGAFNSSSDREQGTVAHLFNGKGTNPVIDNNNNTKSQKSVTEAPNNIAYNSLAYAERINRLVDVQMGNAISTDPQEVVDSITKKKTALGLATSYTQSDSIRRQYLEIYFKRRTRRVSYAEVALGGDALGDYKVGGSKASDVVKGSNDTLRPDDPWIYPFAASDNTSKSASGITYSNLTLNISSSKLLPSATKPTKLEKELQGNEQKLGDRISVGNNLPELWWNGTKFVGPNKEDTQNLSSTYWDDPTDTDANNIRTRHSQIQQLADLGSIERDGEWELAAAKVPAPQEAVGGLRVVTGAGIYLPKDYTSAGKTGDTNFATASASTEITNTWSDMMPVPSAAYMAATTTFTPYPFYDPLLTYTLPKPTEYQPYLKMRATAVYHYKDDPTNYSATNPKPIACVSSYYDPTNSTTAQNITTFASKTLPTPTNASGLSNNGVVYDVPSNFDTSLTTYQSALNYQALLKYPNGRWVNEPLKNALAKTAANRTLSDKSAIHAAICALQILDGTLSVQATPKIPHGAIKEITFLDGRQVKAIDATTGSKNYDLAKKNRQPFEIRATVLDLNLLRGKTVGPTGQGTSQEYLLPNSGIIYATRDDALLDSSDSSSLISPVDFKLDPTRRPNGIMLVNGSELVRENNYRDAEKGLILASNLPVYVKGDFNLHTQEEFTTALAADWTNFYTRTKANLNPNFACRPSDPRLPNCTTGDKWRPAAVLSDAVTLLSSNFREGFRDEGDYDLNDNSGGSQYTAARTASKMGINAYVPQAQWYNSTNGFPKDFDTSKTGYQGSSYVTNFVTPIVRRIQVGEYVTESCVAANVADCVTDPKQWKVSTSNSLNGAGNNNWKDTGNSDGIIGQPINSLKTGSLGADPTSTYESFPRRISFQRNADGSLKLQDGLPIYYGIGDDGKLDTFPVSTLSTKKPRLAVDSSGNKVIIPWFNPQADGTYQPVLQVDKPFDTDTDSTQQDTVGIVSGTNKHENWLQVATANTFNLIIAAGDTPARSTEDNGGLHNFPRFLENWNPTGTEADAYATKISGSFIQIKRSAYATAPWWAVLESSSDKYAIENSTGKLPYYLPPTRQWGYDVALLSQSPDLFAQKLVRIPDDSPDEYFREVGRDDTWVKTLLCAKKASDSSFAINTDQRPSCS
ncbi:hormogonium polysaccharide biosynthesis protein HpsA [Calothrix sp. NIES-2098]|uniref:hormogonium polysaccharide biosynthesis protein HpsA n=1 Tax=Calothrix sp. NIES-2098 TaxID=1954171 RepID=UPI000B5E749D|nr:hypothetical protein NIES2098_60050 [Calothrix sp. NIES-2098]